MQEYYLEFEKPIEELSKQIQKLQQAEVVTEDIKRQIEELQRKCEELKKEIYSKLSPAQRVLIARHPQRPLAKDYIEGIFINFVELHGDRYFRDDTAIIGGFGELELEKNKVISCAVIGQQKGKSLEENLKVNFGMLHPEGYRKALRIMKLAEKFKMPVISFIDTPGAYPGIGAEERGQAEAIARNLYEMAVLETPIICIVIGEGGSGGALGIGVGDKLLMLESAYYSVISPEGCASILFRDASLWQKAAEALKLTAKDLYELGIVDEIIPEPLGGAHKDVQKTIHNTKLAIINNLKVLIKQPSEQLLKLRYKKYRTIGEFDTKKTK
ncbi:MAG: acetyl-CoA carboxylase carboxyltransferase subunit alpha [Endomicrobia bacterium]|nr:acetyl-CoA carboxylase carboxyltransferase subunit alpha [Endomicrobiia bacterium]MDW8055847.1 acetyl-CoA carboxylase carboxyltransferase subunit alpha [Elusimicrobiota bacterium]